MSATVMDYLQGDEGMALSEPFRVAFKGGFRRDMPDGAPCYDTGTDTYLIPEWETIDGILDAMRDSLREKRDLLAERYMATRREYDENVLY